MDQSEYTVLRSSLEKLTLNDNSVTISPDSSSALGQGWRIGFLGLLHMEVFTQRLEEVCLVGGVEVGVVRDGGLGSWVCYIWRCLHRDWRRCV